MIELRQLRYFMAVAEELHFGRAAKRLRVSQPPLSVAIRALEDELGTPLFIRSTRSVRLTPAGQTLKERAAEILSALDSAVHEITDVREGVRGLLRIGFVSSASYTVMPEAVRRFGELLPLVRLELKAMTSGEQLEMLLDQQLDLGLIRDPTHVPSLTNRLILAEPLIAVIPKEHPLAEDEVVNPVDLTGEPLVLFPYRLMPGYVSRVMAMFETAGVQPRIVQQVVHQETVLGLVAAGVGLSILPKSVTHFNLPGAITRPIADSPVSELHVSYRGDLSPAQEAFVHCLLTAAEKYSTAPSYLLK